MKSESHTKTKITLPNVEMIEGPEAGQRFTRLIKGIMNVSGANVRKEIEREHKARTRKKRAKT